MFQISVEKEWNWNPRKYSDLGIESSSEDGISELCRTYFDFNNIDSNSISVMDEDPVEIFVTYTNDLNLPTLHTIVREKIIKISKNLQLYDEELIRLQNNINSGRLTPVDIKDVNSKINKIIEFKKNHTGYNIWELYKQNVVGILNKYVILMSNEYKGKSTVGSQISMDESKIQERLKHISDYIIAVNKLNILKIRATYNRSFNKECLVCGSKINEDILDESTIYTCNCGFIENQVKHISEYVDPNKIPPQIFSENANIKTIQTWINRVTCSVIEVYPMKEMFQKFDEDCIVKNLPNRFQVLNGQLPQPPMSTVINLLQGKYSEYYPIKHQIRMDYYGYNPIILSENQIAFIISLYIEFQKNYTLTKGRKTNIQIEILGCLFILLSGVNISISDFKIPESEDTIVYSYSKIIETMIIMGYDPTMIKSLLDIIFY